MKKFDTSNLSQVLIAEGKKLITSRDIQEELAEPGFGPRDPGGAVKVNLRHFGRCQRVTIIEYNGNDYTQEVSGDDGQPEKQQAPEGAHVYIDLKHAPRIKCVDLSGFDGKPGSIIRIMPKKPVRFIKVTVHISDLYGRVLVHDQALDVYDQQEWTFCYFPRHKLSPEPGNLRITICASEKPREPREIPVDVYELPPEKLRELVVCQN